MVQKKKINKKAKKNKKNYIGWFFVIAILLGFCYWGYSYLKSPVYQPIKAVPNDAMVVLSVHNSKSFLDALNYDNALWEGLKQSKDINKLDKEIKRLDSLLLMDDDLWDIPEKNDFFWSLHEEKDEIKSLFVIGLGNAHHESNVNRFIKNYFNYNATISKNSLNDFNYFSVKNNEFTFFYSVAYGVFIASESSVLLEKSLQQLENGSGVISQSDFIEIMETTGKKVDANLFISNKKLSTLSKNFALKAPFSFLRNLSNLSSWNGLDLYIKSDLWSLNGYTSISDADLLILFQAQQPVENKGLLLIPKETNAFLQLGFSNSELFFDNLLQYQSQKKLLDAINQKFSVDLLEDFKEFSGNELYFFLNENAPTLLIHLSDIEQARLTMLQLSDTKKEYHAGNIIKFNSFEFCNAVFGTNIFKIQPTVWSIFGDYLILSESSSSIKTIIDIKENITSSTSFQSISENIIDHSNLMFYLDLHNANPFMKKNCSKKYYDQFLNNKSIINDFNGFCVQFSASSGLFYNNSIVSFNAEAIQKYKSEIIYEKAEEIESQHITEQIFDVISDAVFDQVDSDSLEKETKKEEIVKTGEKLKTMLQNKMILKPFPVYDHVAKENKFVVFDNQSNIYLVDIKGNIIWKKALNDQPISDVYQVDFYSNGKIQYLFNSKRYIYCIDLLGNWVSGYPLKLSSDAQNPIAVFDYNNNKDYRIVYVDSKGVIQNYSKEGKVVSGWKAPDLLYKISNPAQLCVKGGNKYLIFAMDNGNVILTNQTGTLQMRIEKSFINSINSDFYINSTNSKGIMLTTDTKGTLIYIPEKGEVKSTSFGSFTDKHYFLYNDFNGDGSNDFIYLDGKKLTVFDRLQNIKLNYTFPSVPTTKPDIFYIDKQCYLSVFVESEKKVYLFTKNGLHTIIPSTTQATIVKNKKTGKEIIIVGNDKEVSFYDL